MKFILLFILAVSIGNRVSGQTNVIADTNYINKANKETQFMLQRLSLSPTQQTQVSSININFFQAVASLRNQYPGDLIVRKQKLDSLTNKRWIDLESVLNSSQYLQYKARVDSTKAKSLNVQQ